MRLTSVILFLLKDIFRNRFTVLLIFLIPAVFYTVAWITFSESPIFFILGSLKDKPVISVVQQQLGLVFIGLAATGLIASFIAMNLMQRNRMAKKRLLYCGLKTAKLIVAKLVIIIGINLVLGIYISALACLLMDPQSVIGMAIGFCLCGFVYGCFGLLVGSLVNRELEGILLIVLLANIDVGWLQNPIYYADAQHKFIIEYLPAFYPSQAAACGAFTHYTIAAPVIYSLVYGMVFLVLSFVVFHFKMNTFRQSL